MVKTIYLTPNDVQKFVSIASQCDFDIDISYNSYIVDAKSFLGVYGLNFDNALRVSYSGYNKELEDYLASHAMAC